MSTIFFIGQNPATGNQTLYSVTAGTLGSIMDSFNPDKDIVEQIWQKRYVFLNATYFDSMKEHARELTDSSVVPRGTADKSVVKCRNLKTDDVKVRFLRNSISQYKRESDISLLLKIEECEHEFTLLTQAEPIQLRPDARHIQELFKIDGDINIYKASDVVSTSTGGNIIAWRVGSYNGHSIITLENSPDAQKYVLVSEDVIVGVANAVPSEFDANAVSVNAQLTVGDVQKDCLVRDNENVHEPLGAHTTHEVLRQWKTYFELSLSNDSGTVVVNIDGCHVDYNVYAAKPLQYIELTQRVEIEGSLSSIGSRWKVESMDENGIVPEINIFTPDVKETITNYDSFIFVNDNPCIALQDTTVTVTQSVMLRPSYSLENNEGRSFGKLPVGSVHTADMVVYDKSGRAWFHITSDEPIELEQSEGIFTRRGWVNGKASDGNYIFSEIEPTVVDDHNVRVKECTYITVKQDLGPVEGSPLVGNAYVMVESLQAVTAEDGEPHDLSYGDKVQLVRLFTNKFQFMHNGVMCELPEASLDVDVRREVTGIFEPFVADDNMLSFDGDYLCVIRGEELHNIIAFVEDDYIDSTDDVIFRETLYGDSHVFKILGDGIHGSYRYVKLLEGDEEEGSTYIAKYSEILIPTRYELAEGDRLKNFTPNDISLKRTPFHGASESEFVPAGTTLDLSSAFGVTLNTNWGIGVDDNKYTDAPLYEEIHDPNFDNAREVFFFGNTVNLSPVAFYDNDGVETGWVSNDSLVFNIRSDGHILSNLTAINYARICTAGDPQNIVFGDAISDQYPDRILIHDSFNGYYLADANAKIHSYNLQSEYQDSYMMLGSVDVLDFNNHREESCTNGCVVTVTGGFQNVERSENFDPWFADINCLHVPGIDEFRMADKSKFVDSLGFEDTNCFVLIHKYADLTESEFGNYITEQELGDNSFEVSIDPCSGTDSYTVSKYFYCGMSASGTDCILPVSTYETKQVMAGLVANMVRKIRVDADNEVFYISDDGYAYPASILSAIGQVTTITRFDSPKNVWVTKDSTVVSTHMNPSITSDAPSNIMIRQARSLSGIAEVAEQERDPHGFFLKLLGSSSQNLQGSDTILLAEINGEEVYIDIVEDGDDIYVVEVTDENLKTVFVGNADETTTVAGIDSTDGEIAESDAFDYYTAVLHAGDIVTFTKSFMGVNEKVYLFVKEGNGVIHSAKASRLASDFIDIQDMGQDAPQYYFKDRSSVLAPMTYQLNGENISEAELNSVDKRAIMLANVNNPYMVYIAPGVATDAYRSARVSLHQPLVLNNDGTVDVTAYMYLIPNGRMIPKYSASYNGLLYYGFELGVTTNTEVIGEVIVWAAPISLDQVIPATMEDCDLQVFPRVVFSLYSDYSLSSSRTDYAVGVIEGHESIDSFQEFHLDKSVTQNGNVTFYRISQDSGIFSGKYIPSDMVHYVIEDVTENLQLFHKKDPQFNIVSPISLGTLPVIAHSLYMTPTRKFTANMNANGVHTLYEVTVTLSGNDGVPSVHKAWIYDTDCYIVQVPSEAESINDETVTVHANANAYLWDAADAPVMHVFAEEQTFNDFSVVSDENGDRYICVEMARSELNNADSHITVDDPMTPDVNESTEALRVFIPASDVTRNTQGSGNTFLDVADFDVYIGTQQASIPLSKADGSGESLSSEEESALLEYLDSRQNVAHIDAAYVDENDRVVMYRISSESSPVEHYACINIQELGEDWIMNRTVVPLTGQDAVVVDSQEDEGDSVGEILTVLWKFTTTEEDAEFFDCGVAVPVDDEHGSEEIVRIVEV